MVANNALSYQASDLPFKHVTVYGDRAEVNKRIKAHLKSGVNEILVTKLSRSLDKDSIRVEGYGKAVISEVKYQEKRVIKDDEVKDKEKELHERLKKLQDEKKLVQQTLDRFKKQREVLEGIANQIGNGPHNEGKQEGARPLLIGEIHAMDNLEKFLSYYDKRAYELDKSLNEVQASLEKMDEEISVVDRSLSNTYGTFNSYLKEVTIYVSATEDCEAVLDLFYVVSNASWTASYDIRIQTDDPAMKMIYYGLIQQDTDEDWIDAELTLSTANTMVGGQVPELGTTRVSFHPKPPKPPPVEYDSYADERSLQVEKCLQEDFIPEMAHLRVLQVKENETSSTFAIESPTTIPSDDASHKVTIAIIDLEPTFEYEVVPSKSVYAYFKAKTQNRSQFPLLVGSTAVFVNSSFVANSFLKKAVSSSESFEVSLGVDPAVKIEYKAAKKFNEETGILTKSALLTHEQKIGLHNTKTDAVRLTVLEPLPQSTEEKLKVALIEPALHKDDNGSIITINKDNNVEWQFTLAAQEKRELILKYQIEYPKSEQLEYKD